MSSPQDILIGDAHWTFLLECLLRTVVMFVCGLLLMKFTGKKEVRQFSLLEMLVIIGLGSALGDPMIQKEAPVLPSLVAIATTLLCYWVLTKWSNHTSAVKRLVEGRVRRVLYDGEVDLKALEQEGLSPDELFADLRVQHVEHLGQVASAYMEVDGELSVFFREPSDTRPGLSIIPDDDGRSPTIGRSGSYCCGCCGHIPVGALPRPCPRCGHAKWLQAASGQRKT